MKSFLKAAYWAVLYSTVYIAGGVWLFMLAVGVIHHEWIESCPTIGFWWAILVAALLRGALSTTISRTKE